MPTPSSPERRCLPYLDKHGIPLRKPNGQIRYHKAATGQCDCGRPGVLLSCGQYECSSCTKKNATYGRHQSNTVAGYRYGRRIQDAPEPYHIPYSEKNHMERYPTNWSCYATPHENP